MHILCHNHLVVHISQNNDFMLKLFMFVYINYILTMIKITMKIKYWSQTINQVGITDIYWYLATVAKRDVFIHKHI